MSVRKLHLHLALCALFATTAVLWAVRPEGKAAAPPKDKAAPPARPDDTFEPLRGTALRQVLGETFDFHGVDDPKATLGDVLAQMTRKCGVQFDIHSNALVRGEGDNVVADPAVAPGTPLPMKTSLRNVLRQVLRQVDPQRPIWSAATRSRSSTPERRERSCAVRRGAAAASLVTGLPEESLTKAARPHRRGLPTPPSWSTSAARRRQSWRSAARLSNVPIDTAVRLLANMTN
ncbi:MAG: hypothetical protein U0736_23190 [Gemmataceae bacterium]